MKLKTSFNVEKVNIVQLPSGWWSVWSNGVLLTAAARTEDDAKKIAAEEKARIKRLNRNTAKALRTGA